jgi:hypothetical protein
MGLWNVTNVIKFEYFVESDNASEAIKEAMDQDIDETSESWFATQVDDQDETEDDGADEDTGSAH